MAKSWLRGLTPYTKCTVVPRLSYGKEGSASRRNNMGSTGTVFQCPQKQEGCRGRGNVQRSQPHGATLSLSLPTVQEGWFYVLFSLMMHFWEG